MINLSPRRLLDRRPTLGLLTHGSGDPVGHFVWSGVESVAREHNINLICFPGKALRSPHGFEAQSNILYDLVNTHMIDGLIIWLAGLTHQINLEEVKIFCERYRPLPIVTVGIRVEDIPCVTVDNYHGMRSVVSHIAKDHKRTRIAFIRGPEYHQEAEERYQAYKDVLEENGIPLDTRLVVTGGFKEGGARAGMAHLLDQYNVRFDALVAASDNMAIAAIELMRERGIRVPDDVVVAGINNESEGHVVTTPLTTCPLHFYEQGRKSTEMVLDLLMGKPVQPKVMLTTQLLIRQSCGCIDPLVLQASTENLPIHGRTIQPDVAINEMINALEWENTPQNFSMFKSLYYSFLEDSDKKSNAFLPLLSNHLQQSIVSEDVMSKWHSVVSILRSKTLTILDSKSLPRAENLAQQARVIIGETSQRAQAFQRLLEKQRARTLSDINQMLSATIDTNELLEMLEKALPQLGISRCYLSLYENPDSSMEWSRLVMAYDENGGVKIEDSLRRFQSKHLAPEGILPQDRRYSMVVEPLYFRNDQLGFVLLEADSQQEEVYEILRGQISSALKRTRLAEHNVELYVDAVQARQVAEEGRQLAEQADSLKSRFLAMVSHELRTPLTLITGMVDMILSEAPPSQSILPISHYHDLKTIRTSAHHLGRLISDVLDLASSQAGELHLSCEPLNLESVIQEIALLSEAIVRENGLTWRVELTPALPTIWADRTRLKQIILNLVSNAAKFTEKGEVALMVTAEINSVIITVADTGLGIPQGEQDIIFNEFQQSEHTSRRGYGGMGLGLAITRRLVELHGGQIGVRSSGKEGDGSEFYFTVPIMEEASVQRDVPDQRSQTVLLLTEERGKNKKLLDYLKLRGFDVAEITTSDQPNWLTQLMIDPPGALVLESKSAEERGWKLLKLLKQNPSTQNIPIIFYSLSEEKGNGSILEFDYMTKPIKSSDLVHALNRKGLFSDKNRRAKNIMVVDDDPHILNLHARIVRSRVANCKILKAHNGREALKLMENQIPDLVLLDLMMPEMDGFAVMEAMHECEPLRNVPILVLTAQILTAADMSRLQHGVTAVLSKGMFSSDEVQLQIEAALTRSKRLGNEAQRVTRQAMAYIHENYSDEISREKIAQHVGLSERHLHRCFHEETGMSVMTYLNRYRIKQAKALLEQGDLTITKVALEVGFSGSSHFGRIFRQETGISPGAYQKGERR